MAGNLRNNISMENTGEQHKKQYDWLKGYQFVKGQSGNPSGRPKHSKSLKTFAREYLESLPEDEKIEFMRTLPSELIWKMAEGMPKQDTDITTAGLPIIQIAEAIAKKNDITPSSE